MACSKGLFVTLPLAIGNFFVSLPVIRTIWAPLRWNMAFMYKILWGLFYSLRWLGLSIKFVWYSLKLNYIFGFAWREKLITLIGISYLSYFLYYREALFIDASRDYIWLLDFKRRYNTLIRAKAKKVMRDDVFRNEELPGKTAPELVKLV